MARYAKANQTTDNLKAAIETVGSLHDVVELPKVKKDLSKIDVDFENVMSISEWGKEGGDGPDNSPTEKVFDEIEMLTDVEGKQFPVEWCLCGGDWQLPVLFVVYLDHENHLRAYIPSDGNTYDRKTKAAYEGDDENGIKVWHGWWKNAEALSKDVANRIQVKEAGEAKSPKAKPLVKSGITFRQLIKSLRDYDDQLASVMPYARDAEDPVWGIEEIWFDNGVLMIGQTDDEGNNCHLIADDIEKCVPEELLDTPARVKVGVANDGEIIDKYGNPARTWFVKDSVVKSGDFVEDPESDDYTLDPDGDYEVGDWFCKWFLKFSK